MRAATLLALALVLTFRIARADATREIIVAFRSGPPPATAFSARTSSPLALLRRVGRLGDPWPAAFPVPSAARMGKPVAGVRHELDPERIWLYEAPDSATARAALVALRAESSVAWAERNKTREAQVWRLSRAATNVPLRSEPGFPSDPLFRDGRQWGLSNRGPGAPYGGVAGADVRALDAWRRSTGGNGVRLAIADTGIDPDHPDLGGTLADATPRIVAALDVVEGRTVRDLYGHGTPVAGVAAARTNNGALFDSLGSAGVCGGDGRANAGCRIVPIKMTAGAQGTCSAFHLAQAVLHAARMGARAVNVSFAGDMPSQLERLAFRDALTHGCVPVAAAGNRGFRDGARAQFPAAYSVDGLCIQVGASDPWDRRAVFSSHGPGLDLLAPGVDVWTTFMTYPSAAGGTHPGYVAASGTSFAAPFVTGAIGLLAASRPELIDVDFQQLLRGSAHDLGTPGPDPETGWGRLDLAAALDAIGPGIGIWHDEVAASRFEELETDTLELGEDGLGVPLPPLPILATRVRVFATVAVPDSFLGPVRVWPRVAGTTTVRDGFDLSYFSPWAQVVQADAQHFTLSGTLYRTAAGDLPFPRDLARFGFTVIGRVNRAPGPAVIAAAPGPLPRIVLAAKPNPFGRTTRITASRPARVEVFDVRGRRMRYVMLGGSFPAFTWDGTDDRGRQLSPGIYLARAGEGTRPLKLLKLE